MSFLGTNDVGAPEAFALDADLVAALTAQGAKGERAVNLLTTAGLMLSAPQHYPAAAEVAQSCCRGALDSILAIAGDGFTGLQSARTKVITQSKSAVEALRVDASDLAERLNALGDAVDALVLEENDQGGFRVRQVGHLIREQTQREMGTAERSAARDSWSRFYRDASAVLHGSTSSLGTARQLWRELVAAIGQLFLGLPERAQRVRELALLPAPLQQDAAEVALMTDPRAGDYFFRVASSPEWLNLLPAERLIPGQDRWSARPYLQRLLADIPEFVCAWVMGQLETLRQRSPHAEATALHLLREAGIHALPVMQEAVRVTNDRGVLTRIADWAQTVPPVERNRAWVQVIEHILAKTPFTDHETWLSGQLLHSLLDTAYPDTFARDDGGKLATGIRYALADTLGHHLSGHQNAHWTIDSENDLAVVSVGEGNDPFVVLLLGAVLDQARADTAHSVPLQERVKPLERALPTAPARERLLAAHLRESYPSDGDAVDEGARSEWWSKAINVLRRAVGLPSVRADVFDFLQHVVRVVPDRRRPTVESALTAALGPVPDQARINHWQDGCTSKKEPLPAAWHTVWLLSSILPVAVVAPWQPLLHVLQELAGPAPSRPEPFWTVEEYTSGTAHGGLTPAPFAQQAAAQGPAAAVATLVSTPIPQNTRDPASVYGTIISDLVAADPAGWAADPVGVAAAAREPALRFSYFNALQRAYQDGKLEIADTLGDVARAAFEHRAADGITDAPGTDSYHLIICGLLQRAWNNDVDLGDITSTALLWLDGHAATWTRPRTSTPKPIEAALHRGGTALRALITWGVHGARTTGNGLPQQATDRLDRLLTAAPDDQALAVIGLCLTELVGSDPAWAAAHSPDLFALDQRWRPAHTWLTHGRLDADLLAKLDRKDLHKVLCMQGNTGALERTGWALMQDTDPLGPVQAFLTELTAHDDGPAAVSALLKRLAWMIGGPATRSLWPERACAVWEAALDAALPSAALVGSGHFAKASSVEQNRWLDLTARTLQQQPALDDLRAIAARAAQCPSSPTALAIVAIIVGVPTDVFTASEVRRYALELFHACTSITPERDLLRTALINAGEVEVAFIDSDNG